MEDGDIVDQVAVVIGGDGLVGRNSVINPSLAEYRPETGQKIPISFCVLPCEGFENNLFLY